MSLKDLKWWGYGLLSLAVFNLILHIYLWGDWGELFWFCSVVSVILAYGLIKRNALIISMSLAAAIVAQPAWIIDYGMYVLFGYMGRSALAFAEIPLFIELLSVIQHSVVIPLAIFGAYRFGYSRASLGWGLGIYVFLLLSLTFFFTSPELNRNCVFYPCDMGYDEAQAVGWDSTSYLIRVLFFWSVVGTLGYFMIYAVFWRFFPDKLRD